MRRGVGVIAVCFLVLFFFGGQAYPSPHKGKSGRASKSISKQHHSRASKAKAAKKIKSATRRSSRHVVAMAEDEPVKLRVKQRGKKTGRATRPITIVEEPAETADAGDNDEYVEYRVRRGDTLEKLAERFNVDRDEITDLNRTAKRRLRPGSIVFIPKTQDEPEEQPLAINDKLRVPWKSEEERGILVKVAKSFSGAPYRFGGDSVRGLDCSAFVRKMYEIFEVQLPRCAREQYYAGPRVEKQDLIAGDLVFFKTKRFAKYPTHVGIYIGDGKFIHASSLLRRGVKVDRLSDSYFTRTYTGAVRVKAPPEAEIPETK